MCDSVRVVGVRVVRGMLSVISSVLLYQVNEGGGDPGASQRNVVDWPMATEMEFGVTVGTAGERNSYTKIIFKHQITGLMNKRIIT